MEHPPLHRRLLWLGGLWLAGVLTVTLIGLMIKVMLGA